MKIEKNVSLKEYTTLRVGGNAEFFCSINTVSELRDAAEFVKKEDCNFFILGGGSNVLLPDTTLPGLTIHVCIKGIAYEEGSNKTVVVVGAGEEWDSFVSETVRKNLWGLENLSGIPGTVGGTPIQNVGAYGVEVCDFVEWVEVFNIDSGEVELLSGEDCDFSYRSSIFKDRSHQYQVVTRVAFRLSSESNPQLEYKDLATYFSDNSKPTAAEVRDAVLEIRSNKFPSLKVVGTAGSFFKNPVIALSHYEELLLTYPNMPGYKVTEASVKIPLGWIIDHVCGMKGVKEGGVGTYEKQALVLVNYKDATQQEIISFAKKISDCVFEKTKIKIEFEVTKV